MSADATETQPKWITRYWKYATVAALIAGWIVAAIQAVKSGQPIPAPPELPVPVKIDPLSEPIDYEGVMIHGHDHDHGPQSVEAGGKPWPTKKITYWIDYSTVSQIRPAASQGAIAAAFRQAWGWWAEVLDIDPVEVTEKSQALVPIRFEPIDGQLGVLAEAYLADGTLSAKPMRFDAAERWTMGPPASGAVSLPAVAAHEIGHALCLGHDDMTAPALMRPQYTSAIPRPQTRDYDRAIALGYAKRAKTPPGPKDVLSFPVQARTDDVIRSLEAAGFKVQRP